MQCRSQCLHLSHAFQDTLKKRKQTQSISWAQKLKQWTVITSTHVRHKSSEFQCTECRPSMAAYSACMNWDLQQPNYKKGGTWKVEAWLEMPVRVLTELAFISFKRSWPLEEVTDNPKKPQMLLPYLKTSLLEAAGWSASPYSWQDCEQNFL